MLRIILYEFLPIETKYLFSVKRLYPGIKLTINLAYYYKGNQRREKNKENYVLFQGKSSYTRAPPLTPGGYELYDSCVDNLSNSSMYIVFERDQCYPEYLIKYKLMDWDPNKNTCVIQ